MTVLDRLFSFICLNHELRDAYPAERHHRAKPPHRREMLGLAAALLIFTPGGLHPSPHAILLTVRCRHAAHMVHDTSDTDSIQRRQGDAVVRQDIGPKAFLALNAVTVIWGSQHAVIKDLVAACPPAAINAIRFTVAAALASPWLPGAPWSHPTTLPPPSEALAETPTAPTSASSGREVAPESDEVWATWRAGVELGGWMFAGYALQAFGLQFTTASRSAFLLYLNVKLVPLFALVFYGRRSDAKTWLSALIAFGGTTLLSYDGAPPNVGDAFSLAAAAASALFILRLEEASRAHEPAALNAATLACSAAFCVAWACADLATLDPQIASSIPSRLADLAPELLYLSVVTTAVANWLQTYGQAEVRAQDAAVIYSLDPVYGAAFSWVLLNERLGIQGFAGAALVLLAVTISNTTPNGSAVEGRKPPTSGNLPHKSDSSPI
ncbi:hypothetical protein AB1Y20_018018 [Prymnesium parvum]|uniref:EamA domain-containing protein n=1 Tax=Prymnesium parvum TaxID=97485 RepID=A0AB34JQR3_PRYPA